MNFLYFLLALIIFILILLALRFFFLWYFKIDKIVNLLEKIAGNHGSRTKKEKEKEKPMKDPFDI